MTARGEVAPMAAAAEQQGRPAGGGTVRAGHGAHLRPAPSRDRPSRRPAAALDSDAPQLCGRRSAVEGQTSATHRSGRRPGDDDEKEAEMLSDTASIEGLACAGCQASVLDEPPTGWPVAAGRAPEFSHRDGSVLCPDARGRIGEPVEVR